MQKDLINTGNEALPMLEKAYRSWTGTPGEWAMFLKKYFIACAEEISKLLPQEESRSGIEIAKKYLHGLVSEEEFHYAEFQSEGSAFNIDYSVEENEVKSWVTSLNNFPKEELSRLIHPSGDIDKYTPHDILMYAAYFAHFVMVFPNYNPLMPVDICGFKIPKEYTLFFSPVVLKKFLTNNPSGTY